MYKVVKYFIDLQDRNYSYNVGDMFPREGLEVSAERFAELAGTENKQGVPLIEKVAGAAPKKAPAKKTAAKK